MNPLEYHAALISRAATGYIDLEHISGGRVADCIDDLAVALRAEHPVFLAAVAWATGKEPFASATLEEAVDDYRALEAARKGES
jgi:hypothetical protein